MVLTCDDSLGYLVYQHFNYFTIYITAAVIIAGKPATGKTSALNTVISALNAERGSSVASVKLARVFPKALDEFSAIFGCVDPASGDWEDGIFTSIFRKAHMVCPGQTILFQFPVSIIVTSLQYHNCLTAYTFMFMECTFCLLISSVIIIVAEG